MFRSTFPYLIIFLVTFIIYSPTLKNSFVWDDEELVVNNRIIHSLKNIPQLFTGSTFNTGGGGLEGVFYRPLMMLWLSINFVLWKGNPSGFHFTQILLHSINACLLYHLLTKLFDILELKPRLKLLPFVLVFALHPVHVESVAYISGIMEPLTTLFSLLSLILLINSRPLAAALFLLLGLLSKEIAVAIIPISYYLLYISKNLKLKLKYWIPLSLIPASVYLYLRVFVAHIGLGRFNLNPIALAPLSHRLLTLPYELATYIKLFFFPHPLFVSRHDVITSPTDPRFIYSTIFLITLAFILFYLYQKSKSRKILLFFSFWFLVTIFPTLNLIPLDMTIAERWMYLPSIGILGILYLTANQFLGDRKTKSVFMLLSIVITILFSVMTILRISNWKNGLTLFTHDITFAPDAYDLNHNLGTEIFRSGSVDASQKYFEKSISLQPNWNMPYNNLGVVFHRRGDLKTAAHHYEESLNRADYYLAYENLGSVYLQTNRSKAIEFLTTALTKLPNNPVLHTQLAAALYLESDKTGATNHIQTAFSLNPSNPVTRQLYQIITQNLPLKL